MQVWSVVDIIEFKYAFFLFDLVQKLDGRLRKVRSPC
jgi:hypothetical protein